MINPNYLAAKALINLLSNEEKTKLCTEVLKGIPEDKINRKKRVKEYSNWLDEKIKRGTI